MNRKILICALTLSAIACAPNTKERSYKRVPNAPDLAAGKVAIRGTVRWKGVGVAGVKVMLCDDVPSEFGPILPTQRGFSCKEQSQSTVTDENGSYLFNNLEPSRPQSTNSGTGNNPATPTPQPANTSIGREYVSYIPVAVVDGTPPTYFFWQSGSGIWNSGDRFLSLIRMKHTNMCQSTFIKMTSS